MRNILRFKTVVDEQFETIIGSFVTLESLLVVTTPIINPNQKFLIRQTHHSRDTGNALPEATTTTERHRAFQQFEYS